MLDWKDDDMSPGGGFITVLPWHYEQDTAAQAPIMRHLLEINTRRSMALGSVHK